MTTGIDKIHLVARDFHESKKVKWTTTEVSTWIDPKTGLIISGDEPIKKTKKFINDKKSGLRIDNDGNGLLIVFNPNRLITNTPYIVRPQTDIDEAINTATTICNGYGIEPDFNSATFSQVDLCRQAEMSFGIDTYQPAFNRLTGSRLEQIKYEKGYYLKNDNCTSVFYDKTYQAQKEYKIKGLPENLQRFELRFKNPRTVKAQLNCNSIEGLKQINVADKFTQFANKRVFNTEKQLMIYPHETQLGTYLVSKKKNAVVNFITDLMIYKNNREATLIETINETYGSIKTLRQICIDNFGFSRERWKKTVKAIKDRDDFYQRTFLKGKITAVDLIQELKEKYGLVA